MPGLAPLSVRSLPGAAPVGGRPPLPVVALDPPPLADGILPPSMGHTPPLGESRAPESESVRLSLPPAEDGSAPPLVGGLAPSPLVWNRRARLITCPSSRSGSCSCPSSTAACCSVAAAAAA